MKLVMELPKAKAKKMYAHLKSEHPIYSRRMKLRK